MNKSINEFQLLSIKKESQTKWYSYEWIMYKISQGDDFYKADKGDLYKIIM